MKNKLNDYSLITYCFFCFVITTILPSCYSGKKMAARKVLTASRETVRNEKIIISQIGNLKSQKLNEENIDSSINNKIDIRLEIFKKSQDSVTIAADRLDSLLSDAKLFRKKYKTEVLQITPLLNRYNDNSAFRTNRFSMIKDGLDIAEKKLFQLAAFFGPGKYLIPEDKTEKAYLMFTPLVDSLILFSNKYSDISQVGSIIINGFADGTGFNPASKLYQELLTGLNKTAAEKPELNMQLSQWRANAIANVLDTLVTQKKSSFKSWSTFRINSFEYGQGETFPTKTIKDYTDDDERRRVVLIYWCVLPE